MEKKYSYFSYKLLYILLLFLNFSIIISTLSFEYPNAVTLKNGNIFIIHKTGLSICDPSMNTILKNVLEFSTSNQISSENYLSKVDIVQSEDGYIISVIINKIYIFNIEGELQYSGDSLIDSDKDIYYTLSIKYLYNNAYYYLVGYIYNSKLNLNYYSYDITTKQNLKIVSDSLTDYGYNSYYSYSILNIGLSCQFLKNEDYYIVCLYYI